ncbi:hypothetical protein FOPE_10241 [Fonsecaea pedrosoi]|nr:hypothetical protein FOPE_10241 [Fonsecaea pedrosoi]
MRHCLDCGLHRKTNNLSNLVDQRRKRIFWTAYMLERSVARTVGRPYSVSDRDIDVALPANIEDSYESEEEITAAIAQSLAHPHGITSLTPAIHIIRIQQLESKICHTVCRVDKPVSEINPHKIAKLRNALEEWKAAIPYVSHPEKEGKLPYSTTDYHMIQYHKALVLLFLPLLPSLSPSHPDFRLFAYSAGQICQMYKRLHNNQSYISFSLLALHANFVAGLALVYCFCLDPTLFDANFSSDIRACSTMLYAISERWPAARKVRNAFESLVSATIEGNHGPFSASTSVSGRTSRISGRMTQGQHAAVAGGESLLGHNGDNNNNNGGNRYAENRVQDSVWNSFETVLEDYQINETWMYDGIIQAMDTFPTDGWTICPKQNKSQPEYLTGKNDCQVVSFFLFGNTSVLHRRGLIGKPPSPVLRDLCPRTHPHVRLGGDIAQKPLELPGAGGLADDARVDADRHHLAALFVEHVERVDEVLVEGGAAEPVGREVEFHVVAVVRVGDVEEALFGLVAFFSVVVLIEFFLHPRQFRGEIRPDGHVVGVKVALPLQLQAHLGKRLPHHAHAVRADPPDVPARRVHAGGVLDRPDRALDLVLFFLGGHVATVDPAVPVAGDLVARGDARLGHTRVHLQRLAHGKQREGVRVLGKDAQ